MPKAKTAVAGFEVVSKPLDWFKPHPENPRGHPEQQVALLAERLEKFGWYKNVVARSDGTLLAGHGMIQAAAVAAEREPDRAEEFGRVPTRIYDGDDMDAVELMVGDNHASDLAVDDTGKLIELQEILLAETGSMGTTGFDESRLEELRKAAAAEAAADMPPVEQDDADVTPPEEPKSQHGEVYELGPHRVMCGDATTAEAWAAAPDQITCVFTDPPYGVDYGGHGHPSWSQDHAAIAGDALGPEELEELQGAVLKQAAHRLNGDAYVCAPPGPLNLIVRRSLVAAGIEPRQWLVWVKHSLVLGRSHFHYRHEHICYGWIGESSWQGRRDADSVFEYARPMRSEEHPTMKPVPLVAECLRCSSAPGDAVADPFLGSGTTLIAAERLGRVCYGIEIEPAYVDVARRRYAEFVGDPSFAP